LTMKDRKKTNKELGNGGTLVMAAATQSWLTDEEWEAVLECLPEIEVNVATADDLAAFGYRKLKNSKLAH
jgi:hypothetical protein